MEQCGADYEAQLSVQAQRAAINQANLSAQLLAQSQNPQPQTQLDLTRAGSIGMAVALDRIAVEDAKAVMLRPYLLTTTNSASVGALSVCPFPGVAT